MGKTKSHRTTNPANVIAATCLAVSIAIGLASTPVEAQTIVDESFRVDEKDFATPEAAFSHFVASVKANDLAAAFQAFAVNDQAEKYDFKADSTRMGAIVPMFQNAPGDYAMYDPLNRLTLLSRYGGSIRNFIYSFNVSMPLDKTVRQPSPDEIDGFVASVDPARLAGLTIADAYLIRYNSERVVELENALNAPIGADESTEIFVLYELEGRYFTGGVHLLRYSDAWKIDSLSARFAGTDANGVVTETSREEFEARVAEMKAAGNVLPMQIDP
jgi:hypothetical protein